jgi:very-short-patch-repair endonuclease
MERFEIKVIRFTNEQVLHNQEKVKEEINKIITEAVHDTKEA